MELNLKYYSGKDEYSDGNIEDDIINYIEKSTNNEYDNIFDNDMRWPVYYHLSSTRENILSWYPFDKKASLLEIGAGMGAITNLLTKKVKRVVSVELSKRRAQAIEKRCKNSHNLEIIVGNFNDIKFEEKFDYITLIGVLEYSPSFTKSDNPMYDFLNNIKKLLKPNGKILIAIENRMGVKYLCGADEDHTNIPYSGINNYINDAQVKTLDKKEMEELLNSLNMKYNFYYLFPDYKFPEIIITDNFKSNVYDTKYTPYYSNHAYLSMNEAIVIKNLNNLEIMNKFANSFFIEVSKNKVENEIELVKFSNMRRKHQYQLGTIVKKDIVIKYPLLPKAIPFLKSIYLNNKELNYHGNKYNCNLLNNTIEFEKNNNTKLINIIFESKAKVLNYLEKIIEFINSSSEPINFCKNTIFEKFDIKIDKKEISSMTFLKKGYLDLTFFNAFVDKNEKLIFIDQEWAYDNVPAEYIIYRNIKFLSYFDEKNIIDINDLYKKYNINKDLFDELESRFINSIFCSRENKFYFNWEIVNAKDILEELQNVKEQSIKNVEKLQKVKEQYQISLKNIEELLETKVFLNSEKTELIKKYTDLEINYKKLEEEQKIQKEEYKKIEEKQKIQKEEYKKIESNLKETVKKLNGIYNSKTWKTIDRVKRVIKIFRSKNNEK